ncbi:MAG: hypothetical protein R3B48_00280 [Kofleriaceae bacterium]
MQRITSLTLGTLLLAATTPAWAQAARKPVRAKVDEEIIDIKANAEDYRVLVDEADHFYVLPAKSGDISGMVFFGDGKTMYQQRVIGGGSNGAGAVDFSLWAPRVIDLPQASLSVAADGTGEALCNRNHPTKLTPASPAESARVLTKAVFRKPLWKRQAKFLARDDQGTYFYVDVLREGGKGHRVYVGQKGAMKAMPMTTLVDDAGGQIYGTKRGELRIVANEGEKPTWRKGKKIEQLTVLEPYANRYLIYRELGIYGQLGSLCDDE